VLFYRPDKRLVLSAFLQNAQRFGFRGDGDRTDHLREHEAKEVTDKFRKTWILTNI
jgi:hypothetical protein